MGDEKRRTKDERRKTKEVIVIVIVNIPSMLLLNHPLNSIFWSGFALEIEFKIKINNRWRFSQ